MLYSCKEIKGNTRNTVRIADTTWTNVKALPGSSNTSTLSSVVIYEVQGQEWYIINNEVRTHTHKSLIILKINLQFRVALTPQLSLAASNLF